MTKIKPIEVDGEKRCSRKCPVYYGCFFAKDEEWVCVPALLQERDELMADNARLSVQDAQKCKECALQKEGYKRNYDELRADNQKLKKQFDYDCEKVDGNLADFIVEAAKQDDKDISQLQETIRNSMLKGWQQCGIDGDIDGSGTDAGWLELSEDEVRQGVNGFVEKTKELNKLLDELMAENAKLKAEVERLNAPCPACNGTGSVDDPGSGNTTCPECSIDACIDKAHKFDELVGKVRARKHALDYELTPICSLGKIAKGKAEAQLSLCEDLLQSFGEVE